MRRWESDRLCLWSTPESIEAGKISFLALIEVVLSVAGYIALARWLDTYWPLWLALIAVPLVLMRSEESVAWAERHWVPETEVPLKSVKGLMNVALATLAAGGVAYALSVYWLEGHAGIALFWRAAVIGVLALPIGYGIAGAVLIAPSVAIGFFFYSLLLRAISVVSISVRAWQAFRKTGCGSCCSKIFATSRN